MPSIFEWIKILYLAESHLPNQAAHAWTLAQPEHHSIGSLDRQSLACRKGVEALNAFTIWKHFALFYLFGYIRFYRSNWLVSLLVIAITMLACATWPTVHASYHLNFISTFVETFWFLYLHHHRTAIRCQQSSAKNHEQVVSEHCQQKECDELWLSFDE